MMLVKPQASEEQLRRMSSAGSLSRPRSGSGSVADGSEAFRNKQTEIRELQEASQSLLRRVGTTPSQSSTPGRATGSVLAPSMSTMARADEERISAADVDDVSLRGSANDLLLSGRRGLLNGGAVPADRDDASSHGSAIVPLSLMSGGAGQATSLSTPLLPSRPALSGIPPAGGALVPVAATPLARTAGQIDRDRVASLTAELRGMQQENASLRQEILDLRRASLEKDKELRRAIAASRRENELQDQLLEADTRIANLSNEVERLRKAGEVSELLKGDQPVMKAIRSYIENDMAAMRADRRSAEQALREELLQWRQRVDYLEVELENATGAHSDAIQQHKMQQQALGRKINSLENYASELSDTKDFHAEAEVRLQTQLESMAMDRKNLGRNEDVENRRADEERRKTRLKTAELKQSSDDALAEAKEATARAIEAERTMHSKLSDMRQERSKMEGKLKKQIDALKAECRDAQNAHSESQVAVVKADAAALEYQQAQARATHASEECAVLHKKCAQEQSKVASLKDKAKWEELEAKQHLQAELAKEKSNMHDEAWDRLSAVEDRHSNQIQELHAAHTKETARLTKDLQAKSDELERRGEEEELRMAARVQSMHEDLKMEHDRLCERTDEVHQLESTIEELRADLHASRNVSESASHQHEALLAVLRREREVADNQFQQLLRHTEEKQKAISMLQNEVDWEHGHHHKKLTSPRKPVEAKGWTCPTTSMPPLVAPKGAATSLQAATVVAMEMAHGANRSKSPGRDDDSDETPRSDELREVMEDLPQDNGVAAMLNQLSVEREVHETRRAAEELQNVLTSVASSSIRAEAASPGAASSVASSAGAVGPPSDWPTQARRLVEQLLGAYEHASRHASDESLRVQAAKQREASLREKFEKVEARVERKHEVAMQELKRLSTNRLSGFESEAVQMEQSLQSAFEIERSQYKTEVSKAQDSLRRESDEVDKMKRTNEVYTTSEAVSIQCKVDAAEAKMWADTREEFAEAKWASQTQMNELISRHTKQSEQLQSEAMDEHEKIRSELQDISRSLHKELMAAKDEQGAYKKREAKLEAKIDSINQDRTETEEEVKEAKSRNSDQARESEAFQAALEAATRKAITTDNQWISEVESLNESHAQELEVLGREIGVFQDERIMIEERLRQQEAFAEARFETYREELEDIEIDLQRTEAVCAERGRMLDKNRRPGYLGGQRSPTRSQGSKSPPPSTSNTAADASQTAVFDFNKGASGAASPPPRSRSKVHEHYVEHLHNQELEKQLIAKMKRAEKVEAEAILEAESIEERIELQEEQSAQIEKDWKAQLGALREDKLRERQMKDRQIDKLKSRVTELVGAAEATERKHAAEAAQHRRHHDEYGERLDKVKKDSQKLRGNLQEVNSERAMAYRDIESLKQELHKSEDLLSSTHHHAQECMLERQAAQHQANSATQEMNALQTLREKHVSSIADLEMQLQQSRAQVASLSRETEECRSTTESVCKHFSQEIKQVLPMLPEAEAQGLAAQLDAGDVPTEASVVTAFKALANYVSALAQRNAELRSAQMQKGAHAVAKPKSNEEVEKQTAQMANLQKDVVKLKEENQEARLECRRLQKQLDDAVKQRDDSTRQIELAQKQRDDAQKQIDDAHRMRDEAQRQRDNAQSQVQSRSMQASSRGGDTVVSPDASPDRGSPIPTSPVLSDSRNAEIDDIAFKGQRRCPSFGGLSNVEMRLRLRQLHAEKTQSDQTLITFKQELKAKTSEMKDQLEEVKAQLWESRHERENDTDLHQKEVAKLQRKIKYLEAKWHERMESEQLLAQEKENVEEQLNLAAKQLEALLAEEGRDGDLQRDLAGLSQQFEQLHGKHRAQLAKSQEISKALEREREKRTHVEEQLHSHEMQIDRELRLAHERHMEQMNHMQDQVQALRKNLQGKEKEYQESMAENTTLSCEISSLRSLQQQQALSMQELQEEVERLHQELNSQSQLLREARDKGPGAKDALLKLRQKEEELEEKTQALEEAEGKLKRAEAEARRRTIDMEDLRRANDVLSEEARRRESSLRLSEETIERQSLLASMQGRSPDSPKLRPSRSSPPREQRERRVTSPPGSSGAQRSWDQLYPESSRSSRRPGGSSYERSRDSEDAVCVVRTAADEVVRSTFDRSPSPEEVRNRLQGQAGLLSALEEIQDTLSSHERELKERKVGVSGSSSSLSTRVPPSELLGLHAQPSDVDRDYAETVDFPPVRPPSPPRAAPIAADVQLKDSEGRGAAVRGYPDSPPGGGTRGPEVYPHSPGREDWLTSLDSKAAAPASSPEGTGTSMSSSGSKSSEAPPSQQLGLPAVVRDAFRRAEALCERQKFDEAVPCFQQVLSILEGGSPDVEGVQPVVIAEVWAHLGVAMQSLDKVREAIDSYQRAVALDGSLHVCFANLATLHAYLNEHEAAAGYIAKALALDANNPTYTQIRRHLEDAPPRGEGQPEAEVAEK